MNSTTINTKGSLLERMVVATEACCLTNLAEAYRQQGRYADAEARFLQALDAMAKVGAHPERARTLFNLGCMYLETGRPAEASACLSNALSLWQEQKAALFKKPSPSVEAIKNN